MCLKTGTIIYGIDDAWSLLWLLMSFFVIWTGFFAAMKIDETYVNVTNGIKNFGSSIGQSALKLPMSIPIPTGGGKSMTLNQLKNAPRRLSANLENQSAGKAIKGAFGGGGGGGGSEGSNAIKSTMNDANSTTNKLLATIAQSDRAKNLNSAGGIKNITNFKNDIKTRFDENSAEFTNELLAGGVSQKDIESLKADVFSSSINEDELNKTLKKMDEDNGTTPPPTP